MCFGHLQDVDGIKTKPSTSSFRTQWLIGTSRPSARCRHLRASSDLTTRLVDAVLNKVDALSHGVVAGRGHGDIGELRTTIRSYCALVVRARPFVLQPRSTRVALTAPVDALEELLAAPRSHFLFTTTLDVRKVKSPTLDVSDDTLRTVGGVGGGSAGGRTGMPGSERAALRLEELALSSILVTAGRIGALQEDAAAAAEGGAAENEYSSAAAREELKMQMYSCACALRRLVDIGGRKRCDDATAGRGSDKRPGRIPIGVGGGGDGEVGVSEESEGDGVRCCASLYATLLLRGNRFRALSEAVGGMLGCSPPLSGPDEMGEPVPAKLSCGRSFVKHCQSKCCAWMCEGKSALFVLR